MINAVVYISSVAELAGISGVSGPTRVAQALCEVRGVKSVSFATVLDPAEILPYLPPAWATGIVRLKKPTRLDLARFVMTDRKADVGMLVWAATPLMPSSAIERCLFNVQRKDSGASCTALTSPVVFTDGGYLRYKKGYVEVFGACAFRREALRPDKDTSDALGCFVKCAPVNVPRLWSLDLNCEEDSRLISALELAGEF